MPYNIMDEGDVDALVMKVKHSFTMNEVLALPVGAQILMIHLDSRTGFFRAMEGFTVTEQWLADAKLDNADSDPDTPFSSILIMVEPVTDTEAFAIADSVADQFGVETLNDVYDIGEGFQSLRRMLAMAAKLGRGLR